MMDKIKAKLNVKNILVGISVILVIVAFIMYLVVATTGYFVGKAPSGMVLTFSILYILGAIAFIVFGDKAGKFDTVCYFVLAAFLIATIVFLVYDKEEVVGDMFIPVNHPQLEINAANVSIAALILYFISFILLTVTSFLSDKKKEEIAA